MKISRTLNESDILHASETETLKKEIKSEPENYEENTKTVDESRYKWPCPICDKRFITTGHRSRHKISAHTDYRYECPLCGAKSSSSTNCKGHLKRIHNLTPDECKKTKITRKLQKSDDTIDNNVLNLGNFWKCGIAHNRQPCFAKFENKIDMQNHQDTVHPRYRFECPICSKRFTLKNDTAGRAHNLESFTLIYIVFIS